MNQDETTPKDHDALFSALRAAGGAWARYGLTLGRTALETSARTLQTTAVALGELAETIEQRTRASGSAKDESRNVHVENETARAG
jgi:hypothetical protein